MKDKTTSWTTAWEGQAGESAELMRWQEAGQWFRYDGHAIFCRTGGRGEALLLLHGFPSASWDWHRVWPGLTREYQVHVADMIGFGFSDKPPNYRYSINDQADLQQGWLETLGIRKVHLLAHDYGVSVAQELLARQAENRLGFRIDSLCLFNGALFPEVHRPILLQNLLLGPAGGLVSRLLTRRVFDANFSKLFGRRPTREELEDFWQLLIYNNGRGIIHHLIHYMAERRVHRHRWVEALRQADLPRCLISGQADPVSGREMADRYEELVPQAQVLRLPGVGHYPHFEDPERVLSAYGRFRQGLTLE